MTSVLEIIKVELLLAENDMTCDASVDLLERFMRWDNATCKEHIIAVFNARKKKIEKGSQYFSYLLSDGSRINCGVKVDAYMTENNLYPEAILEFLKVKYLLKE